MRNRETIARIVMVALLLYALAHFAAARMTLRRTEELADSLQTQYEALREENAVLQARLAAGADIETIEAMARERLGLVMPGEIVFYFIGDRED